MGIWRNANTATSKDRQKHKTILLGVLYASFIFFDIHE